MIFEQIATGGCQSYLLGCGESHAAILIDPNVAEIARYLELAARHKLRIRYLLDTHTHADHFSAVRELGESLNALAVTHSGSPAPYAGLHLKDGDVLQVGEMQFRALHTPGHTSDSMCVLAGDRIFTGDTLLIGGTGRTDLPTGDPEALYDSLFNVVLKQNPALKVFPAHDYKGRSHSTIAAEIKTNPRLEKRGRAEFVEMMRGLNMELPTHLTEALRVNIHGGMPVSELLSHAAASAPHLSAAEAAQHMSREEWTVLDVRGKEAFAGGHIAGAIHLPRGELELRINSELPQAGRRILVCCEDGRMATLAAATLHQLGYPRAAILDGGLKAWRALGLPLSSL